MSEGATEPLVTLEVRGPVGLLTLSRPKVNALSTGLLSELAAALEGLGEGSFGALVITGGRRIFAAGAEIAELADPEGAAGLVGAFARAFDLLAALPIPTIAAVNGVAFGGGLELALACDLRLVASDARLGQPEIKLGVFPGAGGTQRLPRLIGGSRAKELIYTGREVGADEALRIGLVNAVFDPDALLEGAVALGAELAAGPRIALARAKRAIDEGLAGPLDEGLARERELFLETLQSEDAAHGFASFFERGPGHARFTGR